MSLNVATFLFLQGKNILPTCKGVNEQREELVLERDFSRNRGSQNENFEGSPSGNQLIA
jgi:hypothetical protein